MNKILVSTSATGQPDAALLAAAALATAENAELVVLELEPLIEARRVFDPAGVPEAGSQLAPLRRDFPGMRVRSRRARGNPVRTVCKVAAAERPDLIIVPHGLARYPLLSRWAARSLSARVPCPVLQVAL